MSAAMKTCKMTRMNGDGTHMKREGDATVNIGYIFFLYPFSKLATKMTAQFPSHEQIFIRKLTHVML